MKPIAMFFEKLRLRRMMKKHFHIIIMDGPDVGQISFTLENLGVGTPLPKKMLPPSFPQNMKLPRMPVTDPYVYQLACNGFVAIGQRLRTMHEKCQTAPEDEKCDVCQMSVKIEEFLKKIGNEQNMKNQAATKPVPGQDLKIPLTPPKQKIILPNGPGNSQP